MANIKISQLPVASTPLTGDELVPLVQGGATERTTVDQLINAVRGQTTWTGTSYSGEWIGAPSLFRLRIVGTGTVTLDSRDRLGTITTAVETYTVSGATNQIEFPYLGDAAVEMRATYPAGVTLEVLA
jgi:hypothetical protein